MILDCLNQRKSKRGRGRRRQEPEKPSLVGLCQSNILYPKTLNRLFNAQFTEHIKKLVKDLNILLYYQDEIFWKELTQSKSLIFTLESCLVCLTRKSYTTHTFNKPTPSGQDKNMKCWAGLLKVVLHLYYRICEGMKQNSVVELLYDNWVVDIPKILDLIMIYGPANRLIVQEIVHMSLGTVETYQADFIDFLNTLQEVILPKMLGNIQEYCSRQQIHESQLYHEEERAYLEAHMRVIFELLDVFNNLINIVNFFPLSMVTQLVTDASIQKLTMQCTEAYLQKRQRWIDDNNDLLPFYDKIYEVCVEWVCVSMEKVCNMIIQNSHTHQSAAITIYKGWCKKLLLSQEKKFSPMKEVVLRGRNPFPILMDDELANQAFQYANTMRNIFVQQPMAETSQSESQKQKCQFPEQSTQETQLWLSRDYDDEPSEQDEQDYACYRQVTIWN